MGDRKGHLSNGAAFCVLGLWHLFNLLKLQALSSKPHSWPCWFPFSPPFRRLELLFIMLASSISFSSEVFTGFLRHSPLAADGSISDTHISHLEHSAVALPIFLYAFFAFLLDKFPTPSNHSFTNSLAAVAFALELLVFHLHSTDHIGLEGHYHWLFQIVIFATLTTAILGIGFRQSFAIGFVRSISILFQGVWLINTGYMLYTPRLIPKGCFINKENDGNHMVRCHTVEALNRAKGIATLQFCYYLLGVVVLVLATYLVMVKAYGMTGEHGGCLSRSDGGDEVEAENRER